MDDTLTLGAARAAYYERNQFGADGGDALACADQDMGDTLGGNWTVIGRRATG